MMDIHIIQPSELEKINNALDEIADVASHIDTNRDAAPDIAIRIEVDKIKCIFATRYYVFECYKCKKLHATTEADLKMMLKPCCSCKAEHSLVFVEKTIEPPQEAVIRSTF